MDALIVLGGVLAGLLAILWLAALLFPERLQ